jgi:CelD/BcsL family acetyltransferase involved in cellulose biosynthesis
MTTRVAGPPGLSRWSIDDPRWLAFVESHPEATLFHHPAWVSLLAESYGYAAFVLVLDRGRGRCSAGVPVLEVRGPMGGRRWIALPFTDHCPPLSVDDSGEEFATRLADAARAEELKALELRAGLPGRDGLSQSVAAVHHTLRTGEPFAVLAERFSKMHRRNIRRAEHAGLELCAGASLEAVRTFYQLHLLTRRRLGVPIQPWRFFRLVHERLLAPGFGFVLTVSRAGAPVAAAVFVGWNGTLIYKFGASDATAWAYRPNNLLFREAIRWASEHGYHTFDWGRTDLSDHGLREFKAGWGAVEKPLVYSSMAAAGPRAANGQVRSMMNTLIRRSPPWVCRTIGELFYRYAV